MPLALFGRTKDAVVVVPANADWRPGVEAFLRGIGGDGAKVRRHLALLEERAAGSRPWLQDLAGRTLPNGRPMPPGRAYAELLVAESALPLYDAGGFLVSLDLGFWGQYPYFSVVGLGGMIRGILRRRAMIRAARVPSRLAAFCEAARQSATGMDIGVLSPQTKRNETKRNRKPK